MLNVPKVKQGLSKKLAPKWEGPFLVIEKVGPVNYKIKKVNQQKAKIKLVHHNSLKRFFGKLVERVNEDESSNAENDNQNQAKPRKKRKKKNINDKQLQTNGSQVLNEVNGSGNKQLQTEGDQTQNVHIDCPVQNVQTQLNDNSLPGNVSEAESETSDD